MTFFETEPIQNLLRNMKSSFEYSFQHHHHLIQAAAVATLEQTDLPEMALDLTKRRDSLESDTRKSSSYEELSNTRESPNNTDGLIQMHHHRNLSKLTPLTPEHVTQFHYNYENSPSTTTNAAKCISRSRSPLVKYEKFKELPLVRKMENYSPPSLAKSFQIQSPIHHNHYPKLDNSNHFHPSSLIQSPPIIEHGDSNDVPSANISSSSSVASSQKSPSSSITSHATQASILVVTREGKLSRPFKAYPRDPLSLASAGSILDGTSAEKYAVFRKRMLDQIHAANGGSVVVNNPKMRRISNKSSCEDTNNNNNNNETVFRDSGDDKTRVSGSDKDEAYFERRRKNNAAAKKSRDRRRIKEDEIAIRAAFLERENIELKFELAAARKQLAMYNNSHDLKK